MPIYPVEIITPSLRNHLQRLGFEDSAEAIVYPHLPRYIPRRNPSSAARSNTSNLSIPIIVDRNLPVAFGSRRRRRRRRQTRNQPHRYPTRGPRVTYQPRPRIPIPPFQETRLLCHHFRIPPEHLGFSQLQSTQLGNHIHSSNLAFLINTPLVQDTESDHIYSVCQIPKIEFVAHAAKA